MWNYFLSLDIICPIYTQLNNLITKQTLTNKFTLRQMASSESQNEVSSRDVIRIRNII